MRPSSPVTATSKPTASDSPRLSGTSSQRKRTRRAGAAARPGLRRRRGAAAPAPRRRRALLHQHEDDLRHRGRRHRRRALDRVVLPGGRGDGGGDADPAAATVGWRALNDDARVNVRYLVDDVDEAVRFYTTHLGFTLLSSAAPAFADVVRGNLRLLLSGPTSSAGRELPDGRRPAPGGWNRIHLIVDDVAAEVERLRGLGIAFRSGIVKGPGGLQIVLDDPSGNPIELFQPR